MEYRGSPVRMGGSPIVGVLSVIRKQLGKSPGDKLGVTLSRDDGERTVVLPADLETALAADPIAAEAFARLAYSHKRRYVEWILEAKKRELAASVRLSNE